MHRYSQQVIQYCDDTSHVGVLLADDQDVGVGVVGTAASGDVIHLTIKVDQNAHITTARFKAYGGCAIIAVSALVADRLEGKSLEAALDITADALLQQLALPPTKRYCVLLGEDAIKAAVADYYTKQEKPRMAIEQTLSIIKPDAVKKNVIGKILTRFENAGLKIVAAKMKHLSREDAEGFYAVHKDRPFFNDLVEFMISGPVMIQVLAGDNAIAKNREIMGATNPKEAAAGTIRADFAESIDANAVHGSDSAETAKQEIAFFFAEEAVCA